MPSTAARYLPRRGYVRSLLIAVVLLAACSGGDEEQTADPGGGEEAPAGPSAEADPDTDTGTGDTGTGTGGTDDADTGTDDGDGEAAGEDLPLPPEEPEAEPVASELFDAYTVDGDPVTIQVDILGLSRGTGDVLRLDWRFINRGEEPYEVWNFFSERALTLDVSGVSLVDLGENLRYLVLVDDEGDCVCSRFQQALTLDPGEVLEMTATFPAPPPSTTVVDVHLPVLGLLADVPIDGSTGGAG